MKKFETFYASRHAALNISVPILKSFKPLSPKFRGFSWQLCENINDLLSNRAGIESVISNYIAISACDLDFIAFKDQGNGKFKSIFIRYVWSYCRAWR